MTTLLILLLCLITPLAMAKGAILWGFLALLLPVFGLPTLGFWPCWAIINGITWVRRVLRNDVVPAAAME